MIEFRLLYSGSLLGASRNNTRAKLKHAMRKEFHPQLKRLWDTNNELERYLRAVYAGNFNPETDAPATSPENVLDRAMDILSKRRERFGYRFIPLVTEKLCLSASIDILFLRPEDPGLLINSGDLDNRIKTIFDALRMPNSAAEIAGEPPMGDEQRFFCCLLEDDKLITQIRVTTDQLLMLPKHTQVDPNDVFLVLYVKVMQTKTPFGMWKFS